MTMFLCQIYETGNNRMYSTGPHVQCQILHYNKTMFVSSEPFVNVQFG